MAVKRIVANIAASDPAQGASFYRDILGLELAMDHGWIVTWAGSGVAAPQIGIASEGGSGMPVPDLSVEVDDFEAVLGRVRAWNVPIDYGPVEEPWGVRRFFVRDPFGTLVNVLEHL